MFGILFRPTRLRVPTALLLAATALSFSSCSKSSNSNPASPGNGTGIGPNGGTVSSADGNVTLVIPSGALSSNVDISITRVSDSNTCPEARGAIYSLTSNGLTFSKPATLEFHYDTSIDGVNAENLGIAYQDASGDWYGVSGGSVDTVQQTATVAISHFSDWSVYEAFTVTPFSSFLLTGESETLQAKQTGVPVSLATGNPVKLNPFAVDLAQWQVIGSGTLNKADGSSVVFTAPASVYGSEADIIKVTFPVNQGAASVDAFVDILDRNWTLTISDSLVYQPPWPLDFVDFGGGSLSFRLNDDHTASGSDWIPDPATGIYQTGADVPCDIVGSSVTQGVPMSVGSIASWSYTAASATKGGNFVPDLLLLRTNAYERDLPGYDITFDPKCHLDPIHVPVSSGHSFEGGVAYHGLTGTQIWVDDHSTGAYKERITYTLTAQ